MLKTGYSVHLTLHVDCVVAQSRSRSTVSQQEIRSVDLGVCPMQLFHLQQAQRSKSASVYKIS